MARKFYSNKILQFGSKLFRLKVDRFQFNKAQFSAQCHTQFSAQCHAQFSAQCQASNIEDFHAVMDLNFMVLPLIVKLR